MLPTPNKYYTTSGSSEGNTELTAFDGALLEAGIGNINLLKVSSILPPEASYEPELEIPHGSLVPTAYGSIVSTIPGEVISAAVGVGVPEDDKSFGIIMETVGKMSKEEIEEKIKKMVREGFEMRGMALKEIKVSTVEHKVEKIGCAMAAAPLWY